MMALWPEFLQIMVLKWTVPKGNEKRHFHVAGQMFEKKPIIGKRKCFLKENGVGNSFIIWRMET